MGEVLQSTGLDPRLLRLELTESMLMEDTDEVARTLAQEMANRPQTLYGIADSPAGLAAWIGEKIIAWSSTTSHGRTAFNRDLLLGTLTLYWATGTITSSTQPYWAYDRIPFEIALGKNGDNFDRYLVRMAEMEQSMRIAEQALDTLPGGFINVDYEGHPIDPALYVDRGKQGKTEGLLLVPIALSPNLQGQDRRAQERVNVHDKRVMLPPKENTYGSIEGLMNHFMLVMEGYGIRPPAGEAYFAAEGANGELGFYVVSDGSDRPYRVRCRPPCLPPVAALPRMIEGQMVADIIPTFGSVNMIGGELDR